MVSGIFWAPKFDVVIGVGLGSTPLLGPIQKLARSNSLPFFEQLGLSNNPSSKGDASDIVGSGEDREREALGSRVSLVFISAVSEIAAANLVEEMSMFLYLPESSIVVLFNAGNSAFQRKVLLRFLESGYWSIKVASPGFVALARQGSVNLEEAGDQEVEVPRIDQAETRCDTGIFPRRDLEVEKPVLTSYLTGGPDPQGGSTHKPDQFDLMKAWVESIRVQKLTGIVFHDELSESFVERHQDEHLKFVRVPPATSLSLNDYRFLIWRDWLSVNPVESAFFTDLFDVVVNRDPFNLLKEAGRPLMFSHQGKYIGETSFFLKNFRRVYGEVGDDLKGQPELNAGVWGGRYGDVLRFLVIISAELENPSRPFNSNMPAFNWAAYRGIGRQGFWAEGAPLHSEFRKYQYEADVAFVHK